jgi:glycosyltransferase involved in cell wall biosynthesis
LKSQIGDPDLNHTGAGIMMPAPVFKGRDDAMPDTRPMLAYLTSAYGRMSDTFIRNEVEQLRRMGFTVHTFSIRRPPLEPGAGEDVRREQASTEYLLSGGAGRLLAGAFRTALSRPGPFLAALALAQRCSPPGLKPRLWHLAYALEAACLAGRLREKGVGHLHNHIGQNSATVAMLAAAIAGIPYSLTIHGPDDFDQPLQIALGEKVRRSAFTVAISSFGRSQLWRWVHADQWDKVHVVHCGVDETFLAHPPAPPPENRRLISIGRLSEQKGQALLVRAAAILAKEGVDFELALVGDGPLRAQLEAEIAANQLQDKVHLLGWKNSREVREELLASRALVMSSFAEGLPVVIMESLALGRSVLSTAIAGVPELVRDGVNGWLVPAGSVDALAAGMKRALSASRDELVQMGRAGADAVAGEYNLPTEVAKLALLFTRSGRRCDKISQC